MVTPFTNAGGEEYLPGQLIEFNGVSYQLAGKTRSLPVSQTYLMQLMTAVQATDPTLQVKIVSAGQPPKGTSKKRTGSTRHDVDPKTGYSNTADVVLVKNGKEIKPTADKALYSRFLQNAAAVGFTGIGHYSWGVHIGGGKIAAWGPSTTSRDLDPEFAAAIEAGRKSYAKGVRLPYVDVPEGPLSSENNIRDQRAEQTLLRNRGIPPVPRLRPAPKPATPSERIQQTRNQVWADQIKPTLPQTVIEAEEGDTLATVIGRRYPIAIRGHESVHVDQPAAVVTIKGKPYVLPEVKAKPVAPKVATPVTPKTIVGTSKPSAHLVATDPTEGTLAIDVPAGMPVSTTVGPPLGGGPDRGVGGITVGNRPIIKTANAPAGSVAMPADVRPENLPAPPPLSPQLQRATSRTWADARTMFAPKPKLTRVSPIGTMPNFSELAGFGKPRTSQEMLAGTEFEDLGAVLDGTVPDRLKPKAPKPEADPPPLVPGPTKDVLDPIIKFGQSHYNDPFFRSTPNSDPDYHVMSPVRGENVWNPDKNRFEAKPVKTPKVSTQTVAPQQPAPRPSAGGPRPRTVAAKPIAPPKRTTSPFTLEQRVTGTAGLASYAGQSNAGLSSTVGGPVDIEAYAADLRRAGKSETEIARVSALLRSSQ